MTALAYGCTAAGCLVAVVGVVGVGVLYLWAMEPRRGVSVYERD